MESIVFKMKGTAILTQMEFVRKQFGDTKYHDWIATLPARAREVVQGTVLTSSWYEGRDIVVGLRSAICDFFYGGDPIGARELGRFSAEKGLSGVYRIFVRFGSPSWIAGRATQVFSQYFKPGHIEAISMKKKSALLRLAGFPEESGLVEQTIAGFMESAVVISGGKNVWIKITKSFSKGDEYTEFSGKWD